MVIADSFITMLLKKGLKGKSLLMPLNFHCALILRRSDFRVLIAYLLYGLF